MLLCSVVYAMGGNAMSAQKNEHLFYGTRTMNVETKSGMDMDHFSSLNRGELLPTAGLLYPK